MRKTKTTSERAEKEAPAARGNTSVDKECVMERIVDHSNEYGSCKFKVRWYGFASTDET